MLLHKAFNSLSPGQCFPTRGWVLAIAVTLGLMANVASATDVWTQFTNWSPLGGTGTCMLLTDGTVISLGDDNQTWAKLTPDSTGSYANGTWTTIAKMSVPRLYFGSNVLPNGKVFVVGGEYSGGNTEVFLNTGEMYDPVANKWTPIANFPQSMYGDDPSILLPNGQILCGYLSGNQTYLYNPVNNTWTATTGSKLRYDRSDEETWIILPDNSVLSYDVFASISNGVGSAQRYIPSTQTWVDAGTVPVPLSSPAVGYELGPASILPDGRVIQVGANGNIAFYTIKTNTWSTVNGVNLPQGMGADDAPGAMLPNGHFVFLADDTLFQAPTKMYDFYYANNTLKDITSSLPTDLQTSLSQGQSFYRRMLVLPNGHLMVGDGGTFWDYASSVAPLPAWKPTITSVIKAIGSSTYILYGTQLTGLWQGASYGDDVEMDTNYPIVTLSPVGNTKKVYYCKTTNWTPGVSAVGSTVKTSCYFTVPSNLPNGNYNLMVTANGITSAPVSFTTPFTDYVTASFANNTLTLTGDASSNSYSVTQKAGSPNTIVLQAGNNTVINQTIRGVTTSATTLVFTLTGSTVTINADFSQGGNDTVSLVGLNCIAINYQCGPGNDTVNLSLGSISRGSIDGGAGTNTLIKTGTTVTNTSIHHFTGYP